MTWRVQIPKIFQKFSTSCFSVLPGAIVLLVGMLAIYSSTKMIEQNEILLKNYTGKSLDILMLEDGFNTFFNKADAFVHNPQGENHEDVKTAFLDFAEIYYSRLDPSAALYKEFYDVSYRRAASDLEKEILKTSALVNGMYDAVRKPGFRRKAFLYEFNELADHIEKLWAEVYNPVEIDALKKEIEAGEKQLYWSVIAISFSGFILLVLSADRLRKLRAANRTNEKNLALLEQRLAALEASYDGIGLIDKDGNLTYMNRALTMLHGIDYNDRDEYIGRDWRNLYDEKGRAQITDNVMMDVQIYGRWSGKSPMRRKDGKVIVAELSLTALPGGGYVGTARDVTEEQKHAKEKRDLEQQLFQSQKMEAIGRLAGGIAHDFNNILAAINGFAEFLQEDLKEGSQQHQFATSILQAGQQAKGLVQQILAFSRANKDMPMQVVDLAKPVRESFLMLEASFPRHVEITADTGSAPINAKVNPAQIAQIIMNLCVNARDAIDDEKGGKVEVRLSQIEAGKFAIDNFAGEDFLIDELPDASDKPRFVIQDRKDGGVKLFLGSLKKGQSYASLSVRDTGSGMSRVIVEQMFEPFFTTKSVDKGTGLGLATVHGVVISHQGAMVVDTRIGEGTEFNILLPVSEGQATTSGVQYKAKAGAEESLLTRVLLVEDQDNVGTMMMNMMERMGYEPFHVPNGLEALKFIREQKGNFDVVITDYNMPKMTGFELIRQAAMEYPDLPFIVVSGYKEEQFDKMLFEHPSVFDILKKPVEREELKRVLQKLFDEQEQKKKAASA